MCSSLEVTSSAIEALSTFKKFYPEHRREEITLSIEKSVSFIEKKQEPDGSWFSTLYLTFWSYESILFTNRLN